MSRFEDALALFQRRDGAGAERMLVALLASEPAHGQAMQLLAAIRHERGDLTGALDALDRAAALAPNDPGLAFNRAAMLSALKRHGECLEAIAIVLRAAPRDGEALLLQGVSQAACGDHAAALASFEALRLDRLDVSAHRAGSLIALERFDEALTAADRALAGAPRNADAHFHRGVALLALQRSGDALAAFDAALALKDDLAVRAARSTALADAGRLDEALADIDAALTRSPEKADYLLRRAYVLSAMNRTEGALAAYDAVLAQRPDDPEAAYGKADVLLSEGDFARGLEFYEARWRLAGATRLSESSAPEWRGEDLNGKTLLMLAEQGFGDLFQFCRFAPVLASQGARVIIQERPQTVALLKTLRGVDQVIALRDPQPAADFYTYMTGPMRALGVTLETIPRAIPYLFADPARAENWRARLGASPGKRVGVAWSGVMCAARQRWRALDDEALRELASIGAEIVSLQMEPNAVLAAANARQFGSDVADFAELAALIETLDLVISVDTGVAHLAGALGKPVWILLPYRADWRWLRDREDTPWYPQARLFRQTKPGDWSDVIARVRAALQE